MGVNISIASISFGTCPVLVVTFVTGKDQLNPCLFGIFSDLGRWLLLQRTQQDWGGRKSSKNGVGERGGSCTDPSPRRLPALPPSRAYLLPRTRPWRRANTGSASCARLRRRDAFPIQA